MHAAGFDLVGGTPDEFAALIRSESAKWLPVIRKADIKID